jgi:hypothetical protein
MGLNSFAIRQFAIDDEFECQEAVVYIKPSCLGLMDTILDRELGVVDTLDVDALMQRREVPRRGIRGVQFRILGHSCSRVSYAYANFDPGQVFDDGHSEWEMKMLMK